MNLTKERQKEKKARDLICKALEEFHGSNFGIPEFTEKKMPNTKYHENLTRSGIDAGVAALVLINNMSEGSVGDILLYRLLQKYLLDRNARNQINIIITKS